MNLAIHDNANGQGVPCGPISSYIIIPILSKLHWCFGHNLKICMWLRCNPQIFFVISLQVEHSHFSGIINNKVNANGIPCWRNSSSSFIPIVLKLHWCFCHGLKICMWFAYNPQTIFVTFLKVAISHISSMITSKVNGKGILCGRNFSYSFIRILLKLHRCFGHGLKICMWFGYNRQYILVTFFRKLNLAIFEHYL